LELFHTEIDEAARIKAQELETKKLQDIVTKLYQIKLPIYQIAQVTALSEEQVQQVISGME
jgi:ribosome recycling factor